MVQVLHVLHRQHTCRLNVCGSTIQAFPAGLGLLNSALTLVPLWWRCPISVLPAAHLLLEKHPWNLQNACSSTNVFQDVWPLDRRRILLQPILLSGAVLLASASHAANPHTLLVPKASGTLNISLAKQIAYLKTNTCWESFCMLVLLSKLSVWKRNQTMSRNCLQFRIAKRIA